MSVIASVRKYRPLPNAWEALSTQPNDGSTPCTRPYIRRPLLQACHLGQVSTTEAARVRSWLLVVRPTIEAAQPKEDGEFPPAQTRKCLQPKQRGWHQRHSYVVIRLTATKPPRREQLFLHTTRLCLLGYLGVQIPDSFQHRLDGHLRVPGGSQSKNQDKTQTQPA